MLLLPPKEVKNLSLLLDADNFIHCMVIYCLDSPSLRQEEYIYDHRHPMTRILTILTCVLLLGQGCFLSASENIAVPRFDYGLSWKTTDRLTLKSVVSTRYRDGLSDLYQVIWDVGPVFAISKRLQFPLLLRLDDKESFDNRKRNDFLLLDPTITLYGASNWKFDLRTRFQILLRDQKLQFLRVYPRMTHSFNWQRCKVVYFVGNEFYVMVARQLRDQHARSNYFITGLNFPLNRFFEIEPSYKILSTKAGTGQDWVHQHMACLAFGFKL